MESHPEAAGPGAVGIAANQSKFGLGAIGDSITYGNFEAIADGVMPHGIDGRDDGLAIDDFHPRRFAAQGRLYVGSARVAQVFDGEAEAQGLAIVGLMVAVVDGEAFVGDISPIGGDDFDVAYLGDFVEAHYHKLGGAFFL